MSTITKRISFGTGMSVDTDRIEKKNGRVTGKNRVSKFFLKSILRFRFRMKKVIAEQNDRLSKTFAFFKLY